MPFLCALLIVVLVVVLVDFLLFFLFLLFLLFSRFLFLLLFFVFLTADQLFNKFSKLHLRRNGPSVPLRREKEWVILELWSESPTREEIQVLASQRVVSRFSDSKLLLWFFQARMNFQRSLKRGQKKNLSRNLHFKKNAVNLYYLVVSTHLKNISQIGWSPQVGVKIKNVWNHHLV